MHKRARIASCNATTEDAVGCAQFWKERIPRKVCGPSKGDWDHGGYAADEVVSRALEFAKDLNVSLGGVSKDVVFAQHVKAQLAYVQMYSVKEVKGELNLDGELNLGGEVSSQLWTGNGALEVEVNTHKIDVEIEGRLNADLGTQDDDVVRVRTANDQQA